MCKMINQFADKIKGTFSFFDRMIINGYFRPLLSEQTRIGYLYSMGIPLRDFTGYFKAVTDQLARQIEGSAEELGRPVVYLPSAKDKKEDIAKSFLLSNPLDDGLICVLKTLEACRTAKVVGKDGKQFLKSSSTKCLHYYLYYLDKEFGFMFVKIQTWFPFNIQVYINGREFMKHVFDANDISYQCYDNSFTHISDVAKAQYLADHFDSKKLCRRLDSFARSINPFLDTVQNSLGQGYFWCVGQCEFATDVMFQERSFLEDIYPSLVGHAFYDLSCTDVFTFMGRKPDPRFQGEAVSDYKNRPIGCRVKFKLKSNSVKVYDKCSVLRIETTINDPANSKCSERSATATERSPGSGNPWGNPSPTCTATPKFQKPATNGFWIPWLISSLSSQRWQRSEPSAAVRLSKGKGSPVSTYGLPMWYASWKLYVMADTS